MTNLIPSAQATANRLERGLRIYESNLVRYIGKSTFIVASETNHKAFYIVNLNGCTCPDSIERKMLCKHLWAAHIGAVLTIWRLQLATSKQEIEQIAATFQSIAPAGIYRTIELERRLAIERLPRFPLGHLVATRGAIEALNDAGQLAMEFISRHQQGEWGDLSDEDKRENEFSVDKHLRLFSAYHLKDKTKIWIITEADRSATTVLLPSDY